MGQQFRIVRQRASQIGMLLLLFCDLAIVADAQQKIGMSSNGWKLENRSLRLTLDATTGAISILDKRDRRSWRQPQTTASRPPRNAAIKSDGSLEYIADFGETHGVPNTLRIRLRLLAVSPDLEVSAEAIDQAAPVDRFLFLQPFVLSTPDAVLAVADYCDGHLYPLQTESMTRTWFDGGRLDMPFVGVCDLKLGYGYCAILETSDDAFVDCRPVASITGNKKCFAPQIGWFPSKGSMRYPRRILYRFTANGGYVSIAKAYRDFAEKSGLVVPFTEKLKRNPEIRRLFGAPDVWGDASLSFAREAHSAGVEKMLIHGRSTPDEMKKIGELGYLPSEYDNYTDILQIEPGGHIDSSHDQLPDASVQNADGSRMKAWLTYDKKTQYMKRCPTLWTGAAQQVIPELLRTYPYLGRFIDVTTAEGLYECFDPVHPLDRAQKRQAGEELLKFVRSNNLVVGGEHGIWWGAPYQDYIEGMMSGNRFAWPAGHLIHPKSRDESFSGPYGTESWDVYDTWSLGHRWRAPLWELVFHDCVVSTWYWGDSNDYLLTASPETAAKKDAFNVLYGTMPMLWAEGEGSWHKDRALFLRTYRNVCHLHETVATARLLNHEFLDEEHTVQRTRFSNGTVCVVNFGLQSAETELNDHKYVLPENGWAVEGPHFRQSRAVEGDVVVTRISESGYSSLESGNSLLTMRAAGVAKIDAHISGNGELPDLHPEEIQSAWDRKSTRAFLLDNAGVRLRQIPAAWQNGGLKLHLEPTGGREVAIELICSTAARASDVQIGEGDVKVTSAGNIKQGQKVSLQIDVHNPGGQDVLQVKVIIYADVESAERNVASARFPVKAGGSHSLTLNVDSSPLEGAHRLLVVCTGNPTELCTHNKSVEVAVDVSPDFSRWKHVDHVMPNRSDISAIQNVMEFDIPQNAVPESVRVATCDEEGKPVTLLDSQLFHKSGEKRWSIAFSTPGATSQPVVLLYSTDATSRWLPSRVSRWDNRAHYNGSTYAAHFDNGTLTDIGPSGNPVISRFMFSSAKTGWTEEPGTVLQTIVEEDGPVRTVVYIKKQLLAGVITEKRYTFLPDRLVVTGSATGGDGVFSRAYYLQPGTYLDSGGYSAQIDGAGDAEGVSNQARNPIWYSVRGRGWAQSCISLSKSGDITYWDAAGNWGGVGFNSFPMQNIALLYFFHSGDVPDHFAEDDLPKNFAR